MKFPISVRYNTYLAYKPNQTLESNRKVMAELFDWDLKIPKPLVLHCIEKLTENWMGYPKLEELIAKDRELFLQILESNVPLQILVDNIRSDIFWKRCYECKFRDAPVLIDDKKWINIFMERHFADTLEKMNPRLYDPEKITTLVKMCSPYIEKLSIRSLIPSDIPVPRTASPEMAHLMTSQQRNGKCQTKAIEILSRDHVSLHAAIGSLSNLVELHLTYQLRSIGVEYRRDQFQFTNNDAKNLARGLEKCSQLKILRITRSDINCQRTKYILRGLADNLNLETLDFSHCKIADGGASSIAKFIMRRDVLRNLVLADNIFACLNCTYFRPKFSTNFELQINDASCVGPSGVESISQALNNSGCCIRALDLQLNTKIGSEGTAHIAVAIARGCNLTSLNISGCGITPGPLMKPPAGVWSATSAENPPTCGELLARAIGLMKTPLRMLDLSVNNIGSPSDNILSNAICLSYIVDLNLRRSGMGSMAVSIAESAAAAQRLRREAEKGMRFRRSAGRLVQARRVAKGMNIDTDTILLAQQLSARPSIVSVASEEGMYNIQTQPLPSDFGFIPALKSPLQSSRTSSITGPPTSRRSSHHAVLEPVKEIRRTTFVRRGSDGSLLQTRNGSQRHIKIFVS